MKTALVFGITGQDGSYLAEMLLSMGYAVHGVIRRTSAFNTSRIEHLINHPERAVRNQLTLHHGDVTDYSSVYRVITTVDPDEIYNLAAQSHVRVSFEEPVLTSEITGLGNLNILECLRMSKSDARLYQASSSEMFGSSPAPQNESTSFRPRSPYAVSKLQAYWNTVNYREGYGIFCVNGILFNHESPRRGKTFVTKKITEGVAAIVRGDADTLELGNLEAKRDWGYAPDYVFGMWKMLQIDEPRDFVLSTGSSHSVKEFVRWCFEEVGLDWEKHVRIEERYWRPTEVSHLEGDSALAREVLDWETTVGARDLATLMLKHDISNPTSREKIDTPISGLWKSINDA